LIFFWETPELDSPPYRQKEAEIERENALIKEEKDRHEKEKKEKNKIERDAEMK
jgi:hypothetical protein